jgi:hypothetical protein
MAALRVSALLLLCVPRIVFGSELKQETVAAYERYIAALEQRFAPQMRGSLSIAYAAAETDARLRKGAILVWPGREDGILEVPDGLIHHWRGAAFIPDVTLDSVLATVQNYAAYADIYDWVVRSTLIDRETTRTVASSHRASDRFRVHLRIERKASTVTSVVDLWSLVEYHYPANDRAVSVSDADCVRQVEQPGAANERRLPVGSGSGYLWRANTYTTYLQRDGGVYVDLQTVGLSRGFPPLLGWFIEPIARDLGRGSAAETLRQLRRAVLERSSGRSATVASSAAPTSAAWCGGSGSPDVPY